MTALQTATLKAARAKPRKCKVCPETFTPQRMGQKVCSPACALTFGRDMTKESAEKLEKAARIADKAKREAMKTRGEWIKEAQAAINQYRRLQEHALGRTCISCQRPRHEIESTDGWKPGGAWDAGHFQSVGRKPELRFEPRNIWLQCKSCNAGSCKYARKSGTVEAAFEANLRLLVGDAEVDWLKGPHEPLKLTVEAIKQLRNEYRAKANELKASAANSVCA